MQFWEIILGSLDLIFSFDLEVYQIILLSLKVSGIAAIIASILGIITGYLLTIYKSRVSNIIILVLNSLMGIPPVIVGLIVYFIFSQKGPLGVFSILYTPTAIIIAQVIIIYPIISCMIKELFSEFWDEFKDTLRSYNISKLGSLYIFIKNSYQFVITILFLGFGRGISEVGAVMIVGGNIDHYTRVMTTAISLETRKGDLEKAMSLGIVLILTTMIISGLAFKLKGKKYN